MDDSDSPIEQVLQAVRAALHARRAELVQRVTRIEDALRVYQQAVETEIAARFASEHSLKQVKHALMNAEQAAQALQAAVRSLPELQEALPRSANADNPTEPRIKIAMPSDASELAPPIMATGFNRLMRALETGRLVIIGALSGREKSTALPLGVAPHAEWIDTEREGTHAVGNLPQRVKQGRVAGLIILDRVVQHRYTEPVVAAAREAGVPVAFGGQGGRASLLRALEQIEDMLSRR